jgi:asparagine synthase (glutamine-hydrolysing)
MARAMAATLAHRGPDDCGVVVDAALGLAHTRLAVVDLSPTGRQPMTSADGRFVIAYNGEVYNAEALRRDLPEIRFRGRSDTEAILEACAAWGVETTVERLIGMFAFALWDVRDRHLWLARDRLGIKPLYVAERNGRFFFASELKALRAHPGFRAEIDRDALAAYLRFGYVPAPLSILSRVRKLEPGHILTVAPGEPARSMPFWRLRDVAEAGLAAPLDIGDDEAVEALEGLLADAVERRMLADVPLGALLSGGVDSSTVTALMQAASATPIRTFSIGFEEDGLDEAPHAEAISRHLGTEHTTLYVSRRDAEATVPQLAEIYDEPFADASAIPTYLLSRLTRRHVTVALSGDGGDELFAGYNRYGAGFDAWRRFQALPSPMRAAAGRALAAVPAEAWSSASRVLPARLRPPQFGDKLHKFAAVLPLDAEGLYARLVAQWPAPEAILRGARMPPGPLGDASLARAVPDPVARMQLLDGMTYLPDDILAKLDRASMAASLEARVPLLDHRIVAFAWRLPARFKRRDGTSKWILRQVLDRYVPRRLLDRPKAGFAVPLAAWLRGPLRGWAEALLAPARLEAQGLYHRPIRDVWAAHLAGRRNAQHPLWTVLMFQAWAERWG